jgi:hypothetical protein
VRNNQRRSRARRKEYISELEYKLLQYENDSNRGVTDPKLEILTRENESLKRLLGSLGLGSDFVRTYLKASAMAPEFQIQSSLLSNAKPLTQPQQEHNTLLESSTTMDSFISWDLLDFGGTQLSAEPTQTQLPALESPSGDLLLNDTCNSTVSSNSDSTTLCTVAFQLVLKNNRKGYSAAELELKLQTGYQCGARRSEGCRVDNKVLFNVLADIS